MKRRLRRMVSLVCALALCLGLLPAGALPAKAAPSAQTVEGVSPVGTTINGIDYWENERGTPGAQQMALPIRPAASTRGAR